MGLAIPTWRDRTFLGFCETKRIGCSNPGRDTFRILRRADTSRPWCQRANLWNNASFGGSVPSGERETDSDCRCDVYALCRKGIARLRKFGDAAIGKRSITLRVLRFQLVFYRDEDLLE
jgi:hypothetical protein